MEAFAFDELGSPGSVHEVPMPEPAEGYVRIRVAAAGLNPFDNAVLQGYLTDRMEHCFPLVPGMDASGAVEAVGDGVSDLAVGEDVFGGVGKMYLGEGTLAEFATLSAATVTRKPAGIEHTVAASIPVAGITALMMVDAMSLTPGNVLVAIGATGGVGSYLVQLATARGARVIAICSAPNADYARRLGAVDVVDYEAGDTAGTVGALHPDGIDAVADMKGDRDVLARLSAQVRPGGTVTSAVGAADAETLTPRGVGAINVMGMVNTDALANLGGMLERGELAAPEIRTFALEDAGEALAVVGSGHVRGKIVVVPA